MPDLTLPSQFSASELTRLLNDRLRQLGLFLDHPSLTADMDAAGYKVENLADPSSPLDAVNLRTLQRKLQQSAVTKSSATAAATATTPTTSSVPQALTLSRSGTLAIMSNAFPLVQLPATWSIASLKAIGKQAPVASGAEKLTFEIQVGGTTWTTISIASGSTSASQSTSGLAAIGANALITVNVLSVGLTFPGADWSLIFVKA